MDGVGADGTIALYGINIVAGADAGFAEDVAGGVVGKCLYGLANNGAGLDAVEIVVNKILGKAAAIPVLDALAYAAECVVLVGFCEARSWGCGLQAGGFETACGS